MYLVDQHAAHERVLFGPLVAAVPREQTEAQALLARVNLELTPSQAEVLDTNKEALAAYGFDIEPFGDRNYLLRSVPAILAGKGPGESLVDVSGPDGLRGYASSEGGCGAGIHCLPRRGQGGPAANGRGNELTPRAIGVHPQSPYLSPRPPPLWSTSALTTWSGSSAGVSGSRLGDSGTCQ